jgi:hypothetical protein
MFADFPSRMLSGPHCQRSILRVHDKAQPQQSSTAENWLAGPEKNTESADGIGPAVSRDAQSSRLAARVNGKFANFRYFKAVAVALATAHNVTFS